MKADANKGDDASKEEESKLKKFAKAIIKFLSKEFLWVLFVLLLSIPLAYVIDNLIEWIKLKDSKVTNVPILTDIPNLYLYYFFGIIGLYFTRMVVGSIKTMAKPKK